MQDTGAPGGDAVRGTVVGFVDGFSTTARWFTLVGHAARDDVTTGVIRFTKAGLWSMHDLVQWVSKTWPKVTHLVLDSGRHMSVGSDDDFAMTFADVCRLLKLQSLHCVMHGEHNLRDPRLRASPDVRQRVHVYRGHMDAAERLPVWDAIVGVPPVAPAAPADPAVHPDDVPDPDDHAPRRRMGVFEVNTLTKEVVRTLITYRRAVYLSEGSDVEADVDSSDDDDEGDHSILRGLFDAHADLDVDDDAFASEGEGEGAPAEGEASDLEDVITDEAEDQQDAQDVAEDGPDAASAGAVSSDEGTASGDMDTEHP